MAVFMWMTVHATLFAADAKALPPTGRVTGVNQAGRILPPLPVFKDPVLFNSPEADAILAALQIFPPDNPWNEDISRYPVAPNSSQILAAIGAEAHLAFNLDMNFVLVPPNQPRVKVELTTYPEESDKGPYPVPENAPIEGWPSLTPRLDDIQQNGDGDRHMVVVDPANGLIYEFLNAKKTAGGWRAACEATFDLKSNKLRTKGWTSTDAAGLPIFPSIVRFDECERGMVEHAIRFTVKNSRKEFIYPATHFASKKTDPNLPAMGQRFRLKADVDISAFPKHARAVALALKKYGMIVADNGGNWRISVAPDPRLKGLDALKKLKGSDFEAIKTTGENEPPRIR